MTIQQGTVASPEFHDGRDILALDESEQCGGAATAFPLGHEPMSPGWLLLGQDAVVRDRDRGPGDCLEVDRRGRWMGSAR